jgi:hypothetical protein
MSSSRRNSGNEFDELRAQSSGLRRSSDAGRDEFSRLEMPEIQETRSQRDSGIGFDELETQSSRLRNSDGGFDEFSRQEIPESLQETRSQRDSGIGFDELDAQSSREQKTSLDAGFDESSRLAYPEIQTMGGGSRKNSREGFDGLAAQAASSRRRSSYAPQGYTLPEIAEIRRRSSRRYSWHGL